jgi:hypothetical protein
VTAHQALKVSDDDDAVDEPEPEVPFDAHQHAST